MAMPLNVPGYNFESRLESQDATIFIGWYSFILHLVCTFYFLDIYRGSNSDWAVSPLFEYSGEAMQTLALALAIYSALYMLIGSVGLIRGVKTETRIYYFPWLFLTAVEDTLLFYRVFFLFWRYSYDPDISVMALALFIFATYNTYLYTIVLSNYRFLKRIQNPTLIFLPEA